MDDTNVIQKQIEKYQSEGFSDDLGLFSTTCLARRHTSEVKKLQSLWWNEICEGSKRDQLSFTYCLWKLNMRCNVIPGFCRIKPSNFFKMVSHYRPKGISFL
jgi:hypothetical protein